MEHFSIFEPDDEMWERQYECALEELEQQFELDEEQEREDQEYADRLERIVATATLGQLADHRCPIEAKCLDCHHRALLNPKHLLGKVKSSASIREIGAKLRCRKCGAHSATAYFDPDRLDS